MWPLADFLRLLALQGVGGTVTVSWGHSGNLGRNSQGEEMGHPADS